MLSRPAPAAEVKPRLRGLSHALAFVLVVPLGVALGMNAHTTRERVAVTAFAASVVVMFGASGLYHRVNWSEARRRWMRTLDHAGIFVLIAGTYAAFGLLVLDGAWQVVLLAIAWTGAACAVLLNVAWTTVPKWLSAALGIGLGWVAVVALPQFAPRIGAGGLALVLAGGLAYTVGAVIFATRRPNPFPATFGYHEVFHVLVIAAVACHYAAVAFFVVPAS